METKIIFLVRSYKRPDFLKQTLTSLLKSDIDLCKKRYIYDDCSPDKATNQLLKDPSIINVNGKEFTVIKARRNRGVLKSYLEAIKYIQKTHPDYDYIVSVDNDVVVKSNFITKFLVEFKKAAAHYGSKQILFTGFNSSNAHINMIEDHDTFYRKKSCGGVSYFFNRALHEVIIEGWTVAEDNGVCDLMEKKQLPLCCLKKSSVNHMGSIGLHSNGVYWDTDINYIYDYEPEQAVTLSVNTSNIFETTIVPGLYTISLVQEQPINYTNGLLSVHDYLDSDVRDVNSRYAMVHKEKGTDMWQIDAFDNAYTISLSNMPDKKKDEIDADDIEQSPAYLTSHKFYEDDMRNVESNYVFVHKAKTSGFKWTFEQTGQPDQFYIVLADTELKGGVLTAHTTLPNDQRDTASIFLHVNKLRLDNAKWRFEKIA